MTAIPKIKPEIYRWEDAVIASTLSARAKLTAIVLRRYMNPDLQCWPGHAALARDTSMSERRVREALAELKKAGFIAWRKLGYGKQNKYAGRFPVGETAPLESGDIRRIENSQSGDIRRFNPADTAEKQPNELLKNPPLPLPRREKHGGTVPGQTRTKIPRGPRPERLAAKTETLSPGARLLASMNEEYGNG